MLLARCPSAAKALRQMANIMGMCDESFDSQMSSDTTCAEVNAIKLHLCPDYPPQRPPKPILGDKPMFTLNSSFVEMTDFRSTSMWLSVAEGPVGLLAADGLQRIGSSTCV